MSLARIVVATAAVFLLAVDSQAQGPGGGRRGFGPRGGNDLVYLIALREVREELSTDVEQDELLDALSADLRDQQRVVFRGGFDAPPGPGGEGSAPDDVRGQMRRLGDASEKLIGAILEPDQAERLAELRVQFEGLRAFDRDVFIKALKLTQIQQDQIREIRGDRRPTAELEAEVRMSLTEEQITQWDQMKGKSFTFPERRGRFGRRGFRGPRSDQDDD